MPCYDGREEYEQDEQRKRNLKLYGMRATDKEVGYEMACRMARFIYNTFPLSSVPDDKVRHWIEAHKNHDEKQGRKW
jgi:hypothetical protein